MEQPKISNKKQSGNNDAVSDAYKLFSNNGYSKSQDDFVQLISSNPEALNDAHKLFKDNGYSKDVNEFSNLLGLKKKEQSNSIAPKTNTESVSKPISSVSAKSKDTIGQTAFSNPIVKPTSAPKTIPQQAFQEFEKAKSVSDEFKNKTIQEVESESANEGIWNQAKTIGKQAFNTVVDSATMKLSSGTSVKSPLRFDDAPLTSEKEQATKESLEQKKSNPDNYIQPTEQDILMRAKQIAVDKKVKSKSDSQVRELLASYDSYAPEKKAALMKFSEVNAKSFEDNDKLLLGKQNLAYEELERTKQSLSSLEKEANKYVSQKQEIPAEIVNNLKLEYETRDRAAKEAYDANMSYNSNKEKLGEFKDNLDVFKRNYGFLENFTGNIGAASADIVSGLFGAVDYGLQVKESLLPESLNKTKSADKVLRKFFQYTANRASESGVKEREGLQKSLSTEDINSTRDFADWVFHTAIAGQAPILGLAATGVGGIAVLGASATGQKSVEMSNEEMSGEVEYSDTQKLIVPAIFGATETASAAVDKMLLGNASRVLNSATSAERSLITKTIAQQILSTVPKTIGKVGAQSVKAGVTEASDEATTELLQNVADKYILGKDVNLGDNLKEVGALGGVMGALIPFGAGGMKIASDISKPFRASESVLQKLSKESEMLRSQLNNTEITESASKIIYNQIISKENAIKANLEQTVKDISVMPEIQVREILDIETKQTELQKSAREINDDTTLDKQAKKVALKGLKEEFDTTETRRIDLVERGANATLNTLEESEVIRLKNDAQRELMKEQNPDGTKNITLNDNEISRKAVEILNKEKFDKDFGESTKILEEAKIQDTQETAPTEVVEEVIAEPIQETNTEEVNEKSEYKEGIDISEPKIIVHGTLKGDQLVINEGVETKEVINKNSREDSDFFGEDGKLNKKGKEYDKGNSVLEEDTTDKEGNKKITIKSPMIDGFGRAGGAIYEFVIPKNSKITTNELLEAISENNKNSNLQGKELIDSNVGLAKSLIKQKQNVETTGEEGGNTIADGNIPIDPAIVEQDGISEQEDTATENVQPTVDSRASETNTKIKVTEKGQEYNANFKDGILTFTDKKGKEPSPPTRRKLEDKYAENFDFTQGEIAPYEEGISDANAYIAQESNNPIEVANALLAIDAQIFNEENVDYKDRIIAEGVGKIKRNGFIRNDDKNNINRSMAKSYFSNEGATIDGLAQELSGIAGIEITEYDIVEFIKENPNGPATFFTKAKREAKLPLENRFLELTGLPALDKFLKAAVNQEAKNKFQQENQTSLDQLTDQELQDLSNQYEQFNNENNENETTIPSTEVAPDIENIETSGVEPTVQEDGGGETETTEPKPKPRATAKERIKIADAKIDDIANSLKGIEDIFGFKIKIDDVEGLNKNGIDIIDTIASIAKQAVAAGIEIDEAIQKTIDHLKKTLDFDASIEDVKARMEPKVEETIDQETQDFEKKKGKKSVLNRAYEGGNNSTITDLIEKSGLNYKVERQPDVEKAAKAFVKEAGITKALEALRTDKIKGGEKAFVYAEIIDQLSELSEDVSIDELTKIEEDYDNILNESLKALDEEARNSGRFISALNRIYNTSKFRYNLSKQVKDYKASNNGVIDEATLIKFKEADAKLKELEEKFAEAVEKLKVQEQELAIKNIEESIAREIKSKVGTKAKAKKLATQIRTIKIHKPNVFSSATLGSVAWDGAIELVATTIEAGGTIADAVQKGMEFIKATDWYKNLGKDTQHEALNSFQESVIRGSIENLSEVTISEDRKIKIPESIIRDYVKQGIKDINKISQLIIDDFLGGNNDITVREVRDAITRYGQTINPSPDDINIEISRLKAIGKLISGLEDVENGIRPEKSGLQRRKPTPEEREMMKIIKDKMRDLPIDEADLSKYWKNALDTYKTRLENRIEDLNRQIKNEEKDKIKRESVTLDGRAKELKLKVAELNKVLNELVGKPELTEEMRIARAEKMLEQSIESIENLIATNSLEFKQKAEPATSDKIKTLRERKDALNKELNALRDQAGLVEARRLKMSKTRLRKQIEIYKDKLARKDFTKREVKPLQADIELQEIQREKLKWQEVYDTARYEAELKDRSWQDYGRELLIGITGGIMRGLIAGGEMSPVLIQGGIMTVNTAVKNPKKLYKIFSEAFTAVGSQKNYDKYMEMLKTHPKYDLMKSSKLALTEADYKMELREETFIGNNLVYGMWNILGKGIEKASKKVFGVTETRPIGTAFMSIFKKGLSNKTIPISKQWANINPLLAFERGNTVYMNEMRKNRFLDGVKLLAIDGKNEVDNMKDFETMAYAVNVFTGRANIGRLENVNDLLGVIFFSFKNTVSVFQQINPVFYLYNLRNKDGNWKKPSVAQKMAVRDMVTFISVTTSMMYLAQAGMGDDEEGNPKVVIDTDPRSSDFMTMKVKGKTEYTRFDPWHGMRTQVVFFGRTITGEKVTFKDGVPVVKRIGSGYKADTHWDNMMTTYMYNKFSPAMQLAYKQMSSTLDKEGNKTYYGETFAERFNLTPLYIESIMEIKDQDPDLFASFMTALGFFGMNSATYGDVKSTSEAPQINQRR